MPLVTPSGKIDVPQIPCRRPTFCPFKIPYQVFKLLQFFFKKKKQALWEVSCLQSVLCNG